MFNIFQIETPVAAQQVQATTRADSIWSKVVQFTKEGWPNKVPERLLLFKSKQQEVDIGRRMSAMGSLGDHSS